MEKKTENKETQELYGFLNTLNWKARWNPQEMNELRAIVSAPEKATSDHIQELTDILVTPSSWPEREAAGKILGFFAEKRGDLVLASNLEGVWDTASVNCDNDSSRPALVYLEKVVQTLKVLPPIKNFFEGAKELATRASDGHNAKAATKLFRAIQNKTAEPALV